MRQLLILLIRMYQRVSRLTPPTCRFHPTCSEYAVEALKTHGVLRGLWLAVRRVCRCHPWSPGGHDPVPALSGVKTKVSDEQAGVTRPG
jgi:hypothetical protein